MLTKARWRRTTMAADDRHPAAHSGLEPGAWHHRALTGGWTIHWRRSGRECANLLAIGNEPEATLVSSKTGGSDDGRLAEPLPRREQRKESWGANRESKRTHWARSYSLDLCRPPSLSSCRTFSTASVCPTGSRPTGSGSSAFHPSPSSIGEAFRRRRDGWRWSSLRSA